MSVRSPRPLLDKARLLALAALITAILVPVAAPATGATPRRGYWMVAADGGVFAFGSASYQRPARDPGPAVVGIAATPSGAGYWLAGSDGRIVPAGDATDYGSSVRAGVTAFAARPQGDGYWVATATGAVDSFGKAGALGGAAVAGTGRIVAMAPTASGTGYRLAGADGGVLSFGDAAFFGSMGGVALNRPIVGMAPTASGLGYWLVASDGGIFSFGDAAFFGSMGGVALNRPIVGMAAVLSAADDPRLFPAATAPPTTTTATAPPPATTTTAPPPTTTTTAPPPSGADPVLVGAGDIAGCATDGHVATAALLDGIPGTVVALGDNAYPDGSAANYACYDQTWGRHKARTRPAVGNHEYRTAGAADYFDYFGPAAGAPGKGYYSYDLGSWHVVVLNSNCGVVDCGPGSAQETWLRADLAAGTAKCTLAYWHHPRFSSAKHGADARVEPLWTALYDYGADLALTGHSHGYERFAPQRADGAGDPGFGLRQFVVGTGGASHALYDLVMPNSEVHNGNTFGVLRLTLHPDSYDWQFVPEAGATFTDAGTSSCHAPPT
jgi:hypothetical protein